MPADLTAWADELGAVAADETGIPDGLDLLGLSRRATVFPALLWNGSRIHRAARAAPVVRSVDRVALLDGLTLLATACGVERDSSMLTTAVEAGLNEAERADQIVRAAQGPTVVAGLTRWVTAAAVCAFVATGGSPDRSSPAARALVDVAGALLVVHPPTRTTDDNGLLLGHTLAAGWLATRLHAVGVVGVAETFELTVASVAGAS